MAAPTPVSDPASPGGAATKPRPRRSGKGFLGWKVWMRSVHLYTSLVGLAFALFFGFTGFVLNHGDALGLGERTWTSEEGQLDAGLAPLDRLTVVEGLRAQFGITAPLATFEVDPPEEPEELFLRFERAGEDVDVRVAVPSGEVVVERERGGLMDTLADVHKGERTGAVGSLLVDLAAILLMLFSLSGFALWLSLPKRRRAGLIALGGTLGLLAIAGAYLLG